MHDYLYVYQYTYLLTYFHAELITCVTSLSTQYGCYGFWTGVCVQYRLGMGRLRRTLSAPLFRRVIHTELCFEVQREHAQLDCLIDT